MIAVDFIPRSVRVAQARRRRFKIWGKVLVVAVGVLAVSEAADALREAEVVSVRAQYDRLAEGRVRRRRMLRTVTGAVAQAGRSIERAKMLHMKREWSALLALISRRLPEACWLTSIATDPPPRASTGSRRLEPVDGAGTGPRRLKLVGHATTAAAPHEFVARLKRANVFRDVQLERLGSESAPGGVEGVYFSFVCVCEW